MLTEAASCPVEQVLVRGKQIHSREIGGGISPTPAALSGFQVFDTLPMTGDQVQGTINTLDSSAQTAFQTVISENFFPAGLLTADSAHRDTLRHLGSVHIGYVMR